MVTVSSEYRRPLPTAEDLPDSDETPVDNELQNDIPNILLNLLIEIWSERTDWFWGVDMSIYYKLDTVDPAKSKSIVPDGFLALGVSQRPDEGGRLSYVLWQEQVMPILALEVVSNEYNGEYDLKLTKYEELGILYYVVYNSLVSRRKYENHQSLEVYKLVNGKYQLLPSIALIEKGGRMVWMPEVGLGIGCERGDRGNWQREWVYWYDRNGMRYPTAREGAIQERQARLEAEAIAQREKLAKEQAEAIAQREKLAKEQAEAIAQREKLAKEQAEELLKKYRDRFGEISE